MIQLEALPQRPVLTRQLRGTDQTDCRIKELAIKRTIADSSAGILRDDVSLAVENEYAEGGILPPDDSAEEWLKLLDHHPDQVVGISPLRNFGMEQELLVKNIV